MLRAVAVTVVLMSLVVWVWNAAAQDPKGAELIILEGGALGKVTFPHHRHQEALGDCLRCHNLFAQSAGSIAKAKAEGRLAQKQVMNTLCIQCHRTEQRAGKKSGPTTCSKCHVKE